MRQVVRAPRRSYLPLIIFVVGFVIQAFKPWSPGFHLTWQDLLVFLAVISPFAAFMAFMLQFVANLVIDISGTTLRMRDETIPLDQIVACDLVDAPRAARTGPWHYKIRTPDGMYLPVEGRDDSLVQITLADGKRIAFPAEDPHAVIQTLRRLCKNLEQ